jgi:hypothetical protein
MKRIATITLASLMLVPVLRAQSVPEETPEDPVQKAIREFGKREGGKANEVTVVLDPPTAPETPPPASDAESPVPGSSEQASPVLVTGTPPDDTKFVAETPDTPPPATEPPAAAEESPASPPPRKGLAVRIEKLQTGSGEVDPTKVKLLAPFPAKPLSQAPAGWRIEASDHAPPFQREVELAPGRKISLTVRPHLLVPEVNGDKTFSAPEPGFDPALGYQQNATVGAVLARSIRQLDDDSRDLGNAIDNLQQLLVSLPKPEPPAEVPTPEPAPKPANKR